jgi:hypothetical protein
MEVMLDSLATSASWASNFLGCSHILIDMKLFRMISLLGFKIEILIFKVSAEYAQSSTL